MYTTIEVAFVCCPRVKMTSVRMPALPESDMKYLTVSFTIYA